MFKKFEHEIRIAYPTNEKPDVMVTVRCRCSKYFNILLLSYWINVEVEFAIFAYYCVIFNWSLQDNSNSVHLVSLGWSVWMVVYIKMCYSLFWWYVEHGLNASLDESFREVIVTCWQQFLTKAYHCSSGIGLGFINPTFRLWSGRWCHFLCSKKIERIGKGIREGEGATLVWTQVIFRQSLFSFC